MAEHSGLSTATLSNAHAGKELPSWATVNGYILACGGDPEGWSARWESLRLAASDVSGDLCREALSRWERTGDLTGDLTAPHAVNEGELRELLKTLLDFNGLSHRTLARQAPGYSHVTYGAVLRGARPRKAKILYQILIGCGVYSLRSHEAWLWLHLLSRFSWREGVEGGKLLARVEQPLRDAGDLDLKMLRPSSNAWNAAAGCSPPTSSRTTASTPCAPPTRTCSRSCCPRSSARTSSCRPNSATPSTGSSASYATARSPTRPPSPPSSRSPCRSTPACAPGSSWR